MIKLSEVGIRTRLKNALRTAGAETLEDVAKMTPTQIKRLPELGKVGFRELDSLLADHGMAMKEDERYCRLCGQRLPKRE